MRSDAEFLFGELLVRRAERDGQTPSLDLSDRWSTFCWGHKHETGEAFRARALELLSTLSRSEQLALVRLVIHGSVVRLSANEDVAGEAFRARAPSVQLELLKGGSDWVERKSKPKTTKRTR